MHCAAHFSHTHMTCASLALQAVPNSSGLPLDDIIAVLLLIWFGVQTLRRCACVHCSILVPAWKAGALLK